MILASNSEFLVQNAYDHQGRRVLKTTKNKALGTTNQTQFVYDGWNLIAELSTDGTQPITNFYVWGLDLSGTMQGAGGIGGLLAENLYDMNIQSSKLIYVLGDANGNVTDAIDANGAAVAHYEYDAFGNTVNQSGTLSSENPFRFSTKYHDDETGFYYYGYRYYSPELGRWLRRDPMGVRGGLNTYSFIQNSPIHLIDLLGLVNVPKPGAPGWTDFALHVLWDLLNEQDYDVVCETIDSEGDELPDDETCNDSLQGEKCSLGESKENFLYCGPWSIIIDTDSDYIEKPKHSKEDGHAMVRWKERIEQEAECYTEDCQCVCPPTYVEGEFQCTKTSETYKREAVRDCYTKFELLTPRPKIPIIDNPIVSPFLP